MPTQVDVLSPKLAEQVLTKLGLVAPPPITLAGLDGIYNAWCRRVPFDNVRKLIHVNANDPGVLPGDQPAEFFENWLKHGAGGTCWSGNGALCALLASLGFAVSRGVATMLVAPNLPPNHGTVIVHIDGVDYMVDASILHSRPLRLQQNADEAIDNPAWGVHAHRHDDKWIVTWKHAGRPEGFDCRLEYVGASAQEFSERHADTRGWSPFNYEAAVRLIKGATVIGLWQGQRFEIDSTGKFSSEQINDAQRRQFLIDQIGMHEELVRHLPTDRPTPPPPGSETARRAE
ncbi:MAG TPA: arylamine N-acetyltransferase [Candidatus Obscuribacterales bacterium]